MNIADNLSRIQTEIGGAEKQYQRKPGSVALIAVSKKETHQ
jgi:uncharacterized pyridoxal phosphate-containing UPF0001 family protein